MEADRYNYSLKWCKPIDDNFDSCAQVEPDRTPDDSTLKRLTAVFGLYSKLLRGSDSYLKGHYVWGTAEVSDNPTFGELGS